jgi:hypothetical protein
MGALPVVDEAACLPGRTVTPDRDGPTVSFEGVDVDAEAMEEGGAPRRGGTDGIPAPAEVPGLIGLLGPPGWSDSPRFATSSLTRPPEDLLPAATSAPILPRPGPPLYADASLTLCPSASERVMLMLIAADMASPDSEPLSSGIMR